MTGASGLIGRQLKAYLQGAGHEIFPMNRRLKGEKNEIVWSPKGFDPTPLEGMDAIIHLAGESIASRWTKSKKMRTGTSCDGQSRCICCQAAALHRRH